MNIVSGIACGHSAFAGAADTRGTDAAEEVAGFGIWAFPADSAENPDSAAIGGRIGEREKARAAAPGDRRRLTGRLSPVCDRSHPGAFPDGDLGRARELGLTAPAVAPSRSTGVSFSFAMALVRKTASVSRGPYCSSRAVEP